MITAADVMSKRVVLGTPEERLADVAARMLQRQAHHCVVLDGRRNYALGLVRFVEVACRTSAANRILADLVSEVKPLKIPAHQPARDVLDLLARSGCSEALVETADGAYAGLVTLESASLWLLEENRLARSALEEHLAERDRLNGLLEQKVEQRTAEVRAALEAFRFASLTLSHDVRAPLRSIQGHAAILEAGEGGDLNPEGRFSAQAIKRAAGRLELMADEILAKAEHSSAAKAAALETVDLNAILDDVMEFHRDLLSDRQAVVTRRGALPCVDGRYVPVLQIVANLLANAVKYVPADRQPAIEVWAEAGPERVSFCIKDNGPGVPLRHQEQIFEPFARVPDSGREGFGLGLAIARSAARHIGSEIGLTSDETSGSLFTVSFRKPPPPAPGGAPA